MDARLERCSCGFEIPAGAQFCPGCARPLTPEALEQERLVDEIRRAAEPPLEDHDSISVDPPPIGFGNPLAIRACYWSAVGASLLTNLPLVNFLCFVWYPGAGFLAAAAYRKRTGRDPSTREGVKLGWMTGVLTFSLSLMLMIVTILLSGGLTALMQQMSENLKEAGQVQVAEQLAHLMNNPSILATSIFFALVLLFVFTVALTAAGGALGAKVLEKQSTP